MLVVSDGGSIPSGTGKGNVAIGPDGTLDLNGNSITINGLSGSGTVTTSGSGGATLTVGANDQTSAFDGVIEDGSGTVGLIKTGSGTLKLSGANTYTGGTTLGNGTIALGALDSIFAESDEMTFNTKLDSAFRLAEPGNYSGTFGLFFGFRARRDAGGRLGRRGILDTGGGLRGGDLRRCGRLQLRRGLANEGPVAYN